MRFKKKDIIDWLFNQEQAFKIVEIINPRDFTVVEAVLLHPGSRDKEEVLASNSSMVQYKNPVDQIRNWLELVNERHSHKVGERYIYFRFKRTN